MYVTALYVIVFQVCYRLLNDMDLECDCCSIYITGMAETFYMIVFHV